MINFFLFFARRTHPKTKKRRKRAWEEPTASALSFVFLIIRVELVTFQCGLSFPQFWISFLENGTEMIF